MKKLVLLLVLVLVLAQMAQAKRVNVTLAWDPNPPEQNVTTYHLYFGPTSGGPYPRFVDSLGATEATVAVPAKRPIYFVVTALNVCCESGYSAEVARVP